MAEDVRAVVIDQGSGAWRVGMAGDSTPKSSFIPIVARTLDRYCVARDISYVGHEAYMEQATLTGKRFFDRGMICNWDDAEKAWHKAFYQDLFVAPEEHPVLLTEALFMPKAHKEKMTQIMFETFNTPALFIESSSTLDFHGAAHGQTCLIVNLGHQTNDILPVVDGHALKHLASQTLIAGEFATSTLARSLATENNFNPNNFILSEYVNNMKEDLAYVALEYDKEVQLYKSSSSLTGQNSQAGFVNYELPNGRQAVLGAARFHCMEPYFQPWLFSIEASSIVDKIMECVLKCDVSCRKALLQNIILVGGGSQAPGMVERFELELSRVAPCIPKIFAHPLGTLTAWLGGSILAASYAFQQRWVSKEEYDESGPQYIRRRIF
jgi:actin beta/gamma 1